VFMSLCRRIERYQNGQSCKSMQVECKEVVFLRVNVDICASDTEGKCIDKKENAHIIQLVIPSHWVRLRIGKEDKAPILALGG